MKKNLSGKDSQALLKILQTRFEKNMSRHKGVEWKKVLAKLEKNPGKLWSLHEMEKSGGEPDVVVFDKKAAEIIFVDCAAESPAGRRSFCYDQEALNARKEHKPKNSAMKMAADMGIEMLDEEEYRKLQEFGKFDTKSSDWVKTPSEFRKLGGALFCDRRFDRVFVYCNGAESYYGARGFRGKLLI